METLQFYLLFNTNFMVHPIITLLLTLVFAGYLLYLSLIKKIGKPSILPWNWASFSSPPGACCTICFSKESSPWKNKIVSLRIERRLSVHYLYLALKDKHCIPVGIELVFFFDCFLIGVHDEIFPCKRCNHHD